MADSPKNGSVEQSDSRVISITEEERDLLKSMGLLEVLQETNESVHKPCHRSDPTCRTTKSDQETESIWTWLRNFVTTCEQADAQRSVTDSLPKSSRHNLNLNNLQSGEPNPSDDNLIESRSSNKLMLGIGGTLFLLPHLAILLSLPPVLQRRGAPYLPTFRSKLNIMFDLIRIQIQRKCSSPNKNAGLQFVDLGSGDGRVVFRAAREGLFHKSVGYEINPTLHLFAQARKLITPKYWQTTRFECRDLWNIQLNKYDVIAVYGLAPIMDRLGSKMKEELKPGAIVVSNVFEIPGWRTVASCRNEDNLNLAGKGVYLYKVPECFGAYNKTSGKEQIIK